MKLNKWSGSETEDALCFRCGVEGDRLYDIPPFGIVRCPSCGTVFTSPRLRDPGVVYEDSDYFDVGVYGFERKLNVALALQRTWSKGRLDLIEAVLGSGPGSAMLLEVGCAYGLFLQAAEERGFGVTGVEYSRAAVDWIEKNTVLQVHQGELRSARLPDAAFDVICFWDVIEHVGDPLAFLREAGRVLKAGGLVALSCPNFGSVPARLFRSRWWTLRPEQHLWHFTRSSLEETVREAGFHPVAFRSDPLSPSNLLRFDSMVSISEKSDQGRKSTDT